MAIFEGGEVGVGGDPARHLLLEFLPQEARRLCAQVGQFFDRAFSLLSLLLLLLHVE